MTTKEKLKLMDEIKAANDARVQKFLNTKFNEWRIDFAFVTPDGEAHEDEFYWLKAVTIGDALETANEILTKIGAESGWVKWMVWNIGIAVTPNDDPAELF